MKRVGSGRYAKRDLSDFAEALANGDSISAAGRAIGVTKHVAHKHFKRLCAELGDQAQ